MNNIVEYKKISNLCEFFIDQELKNPNKKFLYSKKKDEWVGHSYCEIKEKISKVASFFLKKKVKKNDRVLLISENRVEWFIFDMAIMSIGAVTVPCFSTNNENDNNFILKDCKPKIVVIESDNIFKKNQKILKSYKKKIILIEKTTNDFLALNDILAYKANFDFDINIKSSDLSTIIYTSGTSGHPKGVMLSHSTIVHNCYAAFELLKDFNFSDERFLSFLPLSHSYERMAGLYFPLSIGAEIFYCESLDNINKNFLEIQPTIMTAVPRLYENIFKKIFRKIQSSNFLIRYFFLKYSQLIKKEKFNTKDILLKNLITLFLKKKIRKIFGGKLKTFVSGGAALNPDVGRFFINLGINILQGYGQTESGPLISCNDLNSNNVSTVGKPVLDVKVKISRENEILVRGPNVMMGYWNNEKLTKETLKNKWLHTGDLGFLDEVGRLKIIGRKKDLIVTSGGENISPTKIENFLTENLDINQAVAFGDNKAYIVVALTLERKISHNVISRIIDQTNKKLNSPEKIRKYIVIDSPFSYENGLLTNTLKVKRQAVFKKYKKNINNLY